MRRGARAVLRPAAVSAPASPILPPAAFGRPAFFRAPCAASAPAGSLRAPAPPLPFRAMSAAEIIELIEKLPPQQQDEVFALLEQRRRQADRPSVRYTPTADAERAAEKIFQDHAELFRKLAQ